jgi:hypothetical protein
MYHINLTNTSAYHPFSYFIRLPTETRIILNSSGKEVNLNTFHGSDDWHESTAQASIDAVRDHPKRFRKPFSSWKSQMSIKKKAKTSFSK